MDHLEDLAAHTHAHADVPVHHGDKLHDAAHLGAQSLGRAANATDSILQNALWDLRAHRVNGASEYGHLPEKELERTHQAMKYVQIGSSIADSAVQAGDGGSLMKNLFSDPSGLPSLMLMPMLHRG
jgi:hypothetical protein